MHRRTLLLAALVPLPALAFARPAPLRVGEIRLGVDAALARRMQARLGVPVRAVPAGLVAALDAGHLELALLTPAELDEASRRMGPRLMVLDGPVQGLHPVTRRVLPPALRTALRAALSAALDQATA